MESNHPIYVGFFLPPKEREKLLKVVTPKHVHVFADHLTLAFGRHMEKPEHYFVKHMAPLNIIGEVSDDRGQCVIASRAHIDRWLAPNQQPHITISCAKGIKPFYSNDLILQSLSTFSSNEGSRVIWKEPVLLMAMLDFFPRTAEFPNNIELDEAGAYLESRT